MLTSQFYLCLSDEFGCCHSIISQWPQRKEISIKHCLTAFSFSSQLLQAVQLLDGVGETSASLSKDYFYLLSCMSPVPVQKHKEGIQAAHDWSNHWDS